MTKIEREWHEYNNLMRRLGSKTKSFEEYSRYRSGKLKPTRNSSKKTGMEASSHKRETVKIPSGDTYDKFVAAKTEKIYTGTQLLGIATMHKSNLVPVFKQSDAEDIARMRR